MTTRSSSREWVAGTLPGHRQEGLRGDAAASRVPPADTALVSSGIDFTKNTVGLAKVSTMCSQNSGAVNQVWGHVPALRVGRSCSWVGSQAWS